MAFIEQHYIDNPKSPINQCHIEIYINKVYTLACLLTNKMLSPVLFVIAILETPEYLNLLAALTGATKQDIMAKIFQLYPAVIKSRKLSSWVNRRKKPNATS